MIGLIVIVFFILIVILVKRKYKKVKGDVKVKLETYVLATIIFLGSNFLYTLVTSIVSILLIKCIDEFIFPGVIEEMWGWGLIISVVISCMLAYKKTVKAIDEELESMQKECVSDEK